MLSIVPIEYLKIVEYSMLCWMLTGESINCPRHWGCVSKATSIEQVRDVFEHLKWIFVSNS